MDILSTLKTKSSVLREILLTLGGVALLFATSQIEIPLKPVPINLQ
ncbi:MAG: biotin transporter BioY, partial [Alphaproteobacteria bacterium]|nr:biotin transporter BioY [Alphaproteobacteria bacterium]